jgi:hypothetical protein
MVLGALICPAERSRSIAEAIRQRKRRHGLAEHFEAKWTKISPAKIGFYLSLVDLFFEDPDLRFRGLVVPNKSELNHALFNQDHDTFYYKMYFNMLKVVFAPAPATYRVYIDIKDTRSAGKERKLLDVLCNTHRDFDHQRIQRLQSVRSHDVEQIQLADVLIGALSYANRNLEGSAAKLTVVKRFKQRSGYTLVTSTPLLAEKVNILRWQPSSAP